MSLKLFLRIYFIISINPVSVKILKAEHDELGSGLGLWVSDWVSGSVLVRNSWVEK